MSLLCFIMILFDSIFINTLIFKITENLRIRCEVLSLKNRDLQMKPILSGENCLTVIIRLLFYWLENLKLIFLCPGWAERNVRLLLTETTPVLLSCRCQQAEFRCLSDDEYYFMILKHALIIYIIVYRLYCFCYFFFNVSFLLVCKPSLK